MFDRFDPFYLLLVFQNQIKLNSPSIETMSPISIPEKQTVALVRELGGPVEFVDDYPVQKPGLDEVLAKVIYTGVFQSGMNQVTTIVVIRV